MATRVDAHERTRALVVADEGGDYGGETTEFATPECHR